NSLRHYELYWAVPAIGAVFTQLNLRLGEEDLLYVMEDTKASVVMVDETLVPMMEAIATQTEHVKHWVILSDEKIDHNLPNAVDYEDLIAQVEPLEKWPNISEDPAFAAGSTPGTTGRPTGVFYSHRSQFLHAYASINGHYEIRTRKTPGHPVRPKN